MKTTHALALTATALITGFLMAHWCAAQSSTTTRKEPLSYDFGALHQLETFVSCLHDSKQTNILKKFDDYSNATMAAREYADLGMNLAILQRLRDGRTNQAYELLEGRLDSDIIGFVASYRKLSESAKDQPGLKVLGSARDYRAKHPFKHQYPNVDEGVAEAFQILDEKKK